MISRFMRTCFVVAALALVAMPGSWSALATNAQDESETQVFELDEFDKIVLQGAGDVVIQIGDTPSLELTADRRASDFIDVIVEDGILSAGFPASLVFDVAGLDPIRYVITTPSISEIHLNGPFTATVDGLHTESLLLGLTTAAELSITGLQASSLQAQLDLASTASLAGAVESQDIEVVNASTYEAAGLDSASAQVKASEASTATVRVRESLSGSASTASTISYISEGAAVDVDTSTLGSIVQLPFTPLPGATPAAPTEATPADSAAASAPLAVDVSIKEFKFDPQTIEVAVGGTVTWTNLDLLPHDVEQLPAGSGFKSPSLPKNGTFSFTFDEAGTFDYYCALHPTMLGQVVVVDG
jgi:amicyanin